MIFRPDRQPTAFFNMPLDQGNCRFQQRSRANEGRRRQFPMRPRAIGIRSLASKSIWEYVPRLTTVPREFLPRSFLELPSADDDEAIVGRGPNILLRDRARRLARRQHLLDQPVGRGQPNEAGDVAAVETLLRQAGDLDLRPEHGPTGYFSVAQDEALGRFQRRRGLTVDGLVDPDGETVRALEDESFGVEGADARRREVICLQNRVRLDNQEIRIDEAQEAYEAANAVVVALSEEADRLDSRIGGQLAITAISAALPAILAIRAGLGIVAALREFARGAIPDIPALVGAQRDADDLAIRFERAIRDFEFQLQELQRRQDEMRDLVQEREALGC